MGPIIRLSTEALHIIKSAVQISRNSKPACGLSGLMTKDWLSIIALVIFFMSAASVYAGSSAPDGMPARGAAQATPDPMQARQDILSDPELQRPIATPEPPSLPDLPRVDLSFLRYVVMAAGAVALILLIALAGPLLFRYFVSARRRGKGARAGDEEVATSAEAIQRAQAASVIQDYRLALRMLYLASLLKLDEIGALRYDRALTNREYVREVALQPPLASALKPVVETFDDVWYGYRPITPDGYVVFESQVNTLMNAAESAGKRE
jgi:hypothetical protein